MLRTRTTLRGAAGAPRSKDEYSVMRLIAGAGCMAACPKALMLHEHRLRQSYGLCYKLCEEAAVRGHLMARLNRTWRALLKVVTTRLLATRDSFAMTMSVIACAACLKCCSKCSAYSSPRFNGIAISSLHQPLPSAFPILKTPSKGFTDTTALSACIALPEPTSPGHLRRHGKGREPCLIVDGDRGACVGTKHGVDGVHALHKAGRKLGPAARQNVNTVPHHEGP